MLLIQYYYNKPAPKLFWGSHTVINTYESPVWKSKSMAIRRLSHVTYELAPIRARNWASMTLRQWGMHSQKWHDGAPVMLHQHLWIQVNRGAHFHMWVCEFWCQWDNEELAWWLPSELLLGFQGIGIKPRPQRQYWGVWQLLNTWGFL